jgi:DivIVA domain-containing protein
VTWVVAVVVVAVLAVVAIVATGRGGEMSPAYDDRPDVRVQADGPLTAEDLAGVRFTTALRGYRTSEVDALLDRLITEMQGRSQVVLRPDPVDTGPASPGPASPAPASPGPTSPGPVEPGAGDAGPAERPAG